ncbi:hypothetical protein DE146DRAFT_627171 [Phaeosphaeria sp. MPI-PUGE-AT-0046c]|nr:hypothetical protein DE146DRAFT_627171 [Phaeosphaeria sp. MPI-PUGE-AT-0046c]
MVRWDKAGGEAEMESPPAKTIVKLAAATSCTPASFLTCQVLNESFILSLLGDLRDENGKWACLVGAGRVWDDDTRSTANTSGRYEVRRLVGNLNLARYSTRELRFTHIGSDDLPYFAVNPSESQQFLKRPPSACLTVYALALVGWTHRSRPCPPGNYIGDTVDNLATNMGIKLDSQTKSQLYKRSKTSKNLTHHILTEMWSDDPGSLHNNEVSSLHAYVVGVIVGPMSEVASHGVQWHRRRPAAMLVTAKS